MTNWMTVFRYELTRQITRKAYLFATFGIPLLAWLVFGAYVLYTDVIQSAESGGETRQAAPQEFEDAKPIGYVDLTGYFAPPASNSPFAPVVRPFDDFSAGEAALKAGDIESLYVVEEDYFESGRVTLWLERLTIDIGNSSLIEAFLVQALAGRTDPVLIARLRVPIVSVTQQRIQPGSAETETSNTGGDFLTIYVFALALMVSTFTASGYLMNSIVEEKESKTIEIILTSVKPFPLLVGKSLAAGLLGLFQIIIWMLAAALLLNAASVRIVDLGTIEVKQDVLIFGVIYFLLGYGFTGAIFAAMGSLTNTTREGSQLAGWVVFPTILPLFFISSFAQDPNGRTARLMSMIPFTAPQAMVMRVAVTEVPVWELAVSIVLLLLVVIGGIWLAGRFFRVSVLLKGETQFRPRRILRYILERSS